ncbi:uncharacterized protein LOC144644773 [Oculina patagonica]
MANSLRKTYDYLFKLLLIGDSGTGKTEILFRFADDAFNAEFVSTIGIDFKIKTIELDGKKIKLQIWDTAGQERFHTITTAYYRGAMHASSHVVIMLIGNKCHKENKRIVSRERALQFATEQGIKFMEVSSKENINIDEAFYTLARDILVQLERRLLEMASLEARSITSHTQQPEQPKGFFSSLRDFLGIRRRKNEKTIAQPPSTSQPTAPPSSSTTTTSPSNYLTPPPSPASEPDQSEVPPEILARGPLALQAYNNALMEGKTCVKRVPVMLIGQERSGKTSLKKSLKGLPFNPDEDSTVGIDVDPSHFKVSTEVWKAGVKDQETSVAAISYEHHAAQLIVGSLMEEKEAPEERATVPIQSVQSLYFPSSENQAPEGRTTLEPIESGSSLLASGDQSELSGGFISKLPETPDVSYHDYKPSNTPRDELDREDVSEVPEEIATLVERLLHEAKKVEDDNDVYSVLWDFGGQSVYYVTHPLFLTPRAIFLLMYDLSRSPHDKANPLVRQGMFKTFEDNFCLKTNLDYLDFWMTSVASLASQSGNQPAGSNSVVAPEKLPPVFLVCTHADDPHGGVDPCALANEIFHFLQNKPYSGHLFERVFVVDNTKSGGKSECPEVICLRQDVLTVAKELPQMKEEIPIKWLQYEKALQVMKEEGHQWISLKRAKEIASEVCKIDDDQEILTLLDFLHDQRILIHFDDTPDLNKLVVLDAQWLIDVFKKVITVKRYDHEEREFKDLWHKLEKTGILEEELLEHVWGALLDQEETAESLIAIMEKFSLMCSWPSSDASCGRQYLVPSMLMSHPPQGITKLLESASIPSLFLKFESRQIPPSLFPRLVLQFFQWCNDEFPSPVEPQLHHNFARFYISSDVGCSVVLLCHPSSLEVVILSENHTVDLDEGSQPKVSFYADQRQCPFEETVARAVRRQLELLLECMKREFCWLYNIRCEARFLCPACCQGGKVNYCLTHRAVDCKQEECLHFWSESELCNIPPDVICRKSADALETRVRVKQFVPWFILPNEKQTTDEVDGGFRPFVQVHEEETAEDQALPLPCATLDALLSQSSDAQDVVGRQREDLQLIQVSLGNPERGERQGLALPCAVQDAFLSETCDVQDVVVQLQESMKLEQASLESPQLETKGVETSEEQALALPFTVQDALLSQSCDAKAVVARLQDHLQLEQACLENPDPETKRMIRCLARNAKCSNRLDVVRHLREIAPAGTTGPLLPELLDVRNIPVTQRRELTIDLSSGDEWKVVAESLGLTPREIRFLDNRTLNPCDAALVFIANQRPTSVGGLYDVLNECGLPMIADLL